MKIYIATHKPVKKYGDSNYQLLHVGAASHPMIHVQGAIKDNEKEDNISCKNDIYCELTGLYYIWKHVHEDIVGLVHYRRYFGRVKKLSKNPNDNILTGNEILSDLANHDIIVGDLEKRKEGLGGYYTNPVDVWQFCSYKNIVPSIKSLYPEYLDDYYKIFFSHYMSFGNMMICKKSLFDEYCEFLFSILFDAEQRWNSCGIGVAPREMGYISEYLMNCWIIHNKFNASYRPINLLYDTNKLGFKVHYLLQQIGLNNVIGPFVDDIYRKFIKK